ncbi:lysyl oxidase family protein [Jiulongibacter sp. NS-SX5]|uniref:lysyl oxidase family protein n=1 Tax=Jiulongibacter sp. NS-SX5 TaxID=3463854 RepID=UPI0040595028
MKKVLLLLMLPLMSLSQTYSSEIGGKVISDYTGILAADTVEIAVKGLPLVINESFGLSKVCFTIQHKRVSDLKVELFSPDGNEIWLTNRNGGLEGENYFQTCFRSNGFNGYVHQAKAPFRGEYIPDGRFEFLNNGQNPNGVWKLIVRDLESGVQGKLDYVNLTFEKDPMPNFEKSPCSLSEGKGCECPDGTQDCDLLPDLVILPSFTKDQIQEYPYNHYRYTGHLRLAATIANIGYGPIEVFGKNEWYCNDTPVEGDVKCPDGENPRQRIYQRVYKKNGDNLVYEDLVSGTNYYDEKPGHDHYHVDDWVEFRVVKQKNKRNGSIKRKVIAEGAKVSYCLFDTGICNNGDSLCYVNNTIYGQKNLPNYGLGNFIDCKSGLQGISVGGYDTYGMLYEGQFVKLPKGLKPGTYILEIEIDPEHKYKESDRSNNIYRQEVYLSKQRKKRG